MRVRVAKVGSRFQRNFLGIFWTILKITGGNQIKSSSCLTFFLLLSREKWYRCPTSVCFLIWSSSIDFWPGTVKLYITVPIVPFVTGTQYVCVCLFVWCVFFPVSLPIEKCIRRMMRSVQGCYLFVGVYQWPAWHWIRFIYDTCSTLIGVTFLSWLSWVWSSNCLCCWMRRRRSLGIAQLWFAPQIPLTLLGPIVDLSSLSGEEFVFATESL